MKQIFKILCLTLLAPSLFLTSCDESHDSEGNSSETKKEVVNVTVSHKLYAYDVPTHTTGDLLEDNELECFKRYKLTYTIDFTVTDLANIVNSTETTLEVHMGSFENEENKHLFLDERNEGGVVFNRSQNAKTYTANVYLTKDTKSLDLTKTFFILGIDSLEPFKENSEQVINYTPVSLKFKSDTFDFHVNFGTNEYKTMLTGVKSNFDWNDNSIKKYVGINATKYAYVATLPKQANYFKMVFYKDNTKGEIYGTCDSKAIVPDEDRLVIFDVNEMFINTVGEDLYLRLKQNSPDHSIPLYVELIIEGTTNFNETVVSLEITLQ